MQVNEFVELPKGKKLVTTNGLTIVVDRPLGEGGQGIVYCVKCEGKEFALKWYNPNFCTQNQQRMLDTLVRKGQPNDNFLWPIDLVCQDGLGYLMNLRPPDYSNLTDLVSGNLNPTFYALITTCFELVNNFMALHAEGFSYGDISFGNVFLNQATGKILICDNDNVSVNKDYLGGVIGTPRFMAPEIVKGEALPSTETDLFSLAVLLFCILYRDHPFDGALEMEIHCLDEPGMRKLYGNPVYIFDPINASNRPVPGIHNNANVYHCIYTSKINKLFEKAFTTGLEASKRIQESQWRQEFVSLRDSIMVCSHCGRQNFYDIQKIRKNENHICWGCSNMMYVPPRIKIGNNIIILNSDTELFPHHISGVDGRLLYDFSEPIAKISQHPTNKQLWGLTNLSDRVWHINKNDGTIIDVPNGKNASIINDAKIEFGNFFGEPVIGEIRC